MLEWLCEEHYKKLCEIEGKEFEIKLLPNISDSPCVVCGKIGEYLTSTTIEEIKESYEKST